MCFYDTEADEVVANYTVPVQFQGYPGIAHGGIIAAMLDEVASRTYFRGVPPRLVVTAKMVVRYRRPVPVGVELRLVGKPVSDNGQVCRALGQIFHPDGTLLAEADLTLAEVQPEFFGEFPPAEEQGWRVYPDLATQEGKNDL
jgi:uncharacterized protein (TIGR00369 family)